MGNNTKLAPSSDSQVNNASGGGVAIVGVGCVMPDAADARTFWSNIVKGHVAIREVPPERWDPALYWSADRTAPDKSYSKIGGFLREQPFDAKRFRIPPKTLESVDTIQRLTLTAVAEALEDAGLEALPGSGQGKPFDRTRTAVIMGNAMGGEWEDLTSLRCWYPRMAHALRGTAAARALSDGQRQALLTELEAAYKATLPPVTEDSMPGELSNCITGRICNALDLQGANFTTDAACASSMAALKCAVDGLRAGAYEVAIVGGADQMMDPPAYVKFSKIGALSATMSAPFDARADGFVMGEGVGVLVLKRLEDAERDGDKIYAVVRGIGAASDGKGKGMTAPNPRGQRMAIERAYAEAGIPITSVSLFEAHGTSTRVGDAVEAGVLTDLLKEAGGEKQGVALGSVKSMIGHLKAAAGAAALVKVALALHHKQLPPSAGYERPPEGSPLAEGYLAVNTTTRNWTDTPVPRRAGVSAFGFGGTNFHAVLEEHRATNRPAVQAERGSMKSSDVLKEVIAVFAEKTGYTAADLDPAYALEADLGIDTVKQAEVLGILRERYGIARDDNFKLADTPTLQAIADYLATRATVGASAGGAQTAASPDPVTPLVTMSAGTSPAKHVAVSTASSMVSAAVSSAVASAPDAATHSWSVVVAGGEDVAAAAKAGEGLLARAAAWPEGVASSRAVYRSAPVRVAFAADGLDAAKTKMAEVGRRKARLLAAQGIFVTEGAPLADRGKVAFLFPGQGSQFLGMFQDLAELYPIVRDTFFEADRVLEPLIGGKLTDIVWARATNDAEREQADLRLRQTEICQPAMLTADVALYRLLLQLGVKPDMVAGHSLGEYAACVAAEVMSFADALYAVSARGREMAHVKVEDCGKMASVAAGADRVEPVLREISGYVIAANKNCHAQTVIAGGTAAVEAAIQRFLELGIEAREIPVSHAFHSQIVAPASTPLRRVLTGLGIQGPTTPITCNVDASYYPADKAAVVELLGRQLESPVEFIAQIERMYADGARLFVEVGPRRAVTGFVRNVLGDREHQAIATNHHKKPAIETLMEALAALAAEGVPLALEPAKPMRAVHGVTLTATVEELAPVISGVAAIFPATEPLADVREDGFARVLAGENFIKPLEPAMQQAMLDMSVVRLDKDGGVFKPLRELADVIQLTARAGNIDLVRDFGLDEAFDDALDRATRLAMAVGIDALRDAGIPLVRRYRTTSTGKQLPDRWALAPEMARSTGVIFASAFPGYNRFVEEVTQRVTSGMAGRSARELRELAHEMRACVKDPAVGNELDRLIESHAHRLEDEAARYTFNRKFLFRVLAMGHAQMAQYLGAQGPNTSVNAACASGPMALAIAADWLELGRCERVLVLSADDVTSDGLLPFMGAGFLAAGAATIESDLARAAVPFGTERNGMILGSGAAGFVLERDRALADRGMAPIAELVDARFSNAAFHGTRLDSGFIADAMTDLVRDVCDRTGLSRDQLARDLVFMSHETYTPARGGSSAAEVDGLRAAFGEAVNEVTVANVKGFTGHPMAVGLEDAVAVKILQHQQVPPVANLRDVDPAFAGLRFARGGSTAARFAFHFAAGFGSQVAMAVFRQRATGLARLVDPARYEAWLAALVGREGPGLELAQRTLRVAEQGGVKPWELGVPSLAQAVGVSGIAAQTRIQAPSSVAAHSSRSETAIGTAPAYLAPGTAPMPVRTGPASISTPDRAAGPVAAVRPSAPADRETLVRELQALFAERTGYDVQDLDPSFQLEADLGVDTVKQAEILAVVRERYGLGKDDGFKLASVPTLKAVADYVAKFRTTAPAPAVIPPAPAATAVVPAVAVTAAAPALAATAVVPALAATAVVPAVAVTAAVPALAATAVVPAVAVTAAVPALAVTPAVPALAATAVVPAVAVTAAVPAVAVTAAVPGKAVVSASAPSAPVRPEPPTESASRRAPADHQTLVRELQALFAERTGYDLQDLDPTFQLEADLGIDTVKQAEILAVVRERYGLGKDDAFKLASVPTLAAVADYVASRRAPPPSVREADAPQAPDRARLLVEVTQLFAERTGYAVADLEPTYQLEADLGIDTVKQAEILAAIRERYGLGKDERFSLADVQTLEAVTSYVVNRLGQAAPKDRAAPVLKRWDAQGRFKLWTVTAVELAPAPATPARSLAGRNVVLAGDDGVLVQAMRAELVRRGANVHALPADVVDAEALFARIASAAGRAIDDLVYVVGDHASWAPLRLEADVSRAFRLARDFGRARRERGGAGLLFVGRSRGAFGLSGDDPTGVVMGAIAGLAKTLAKEWQGARCLAIDCERGGTPVDAATRALDEFCRETPVEVALHQGKRLTLRRGDEAAVDAVQLPARPVVVATGGARGVTYEILRDFAARHTAKIVILARTAEPRAGSTSLEGKSDEQLRELGRAAVAASGERVTPAAIKRWIDAERAKVQVAAHLATLRQLGSDVELIACDVADLPTVAKVAAQIRQRHGAVDLLLHGAGREESKLLADKDVEAFERVFAPKARAGIALWTELAPKRTVIMGSVAGRFGNAGQADYAAANELLAAFARAPERRVLAVDWTAWADVGMATKDSVRQFLESSGVEFLPAEVGARMGSELMGSSLTGDVVASGGLGVFGDGEPPVPPLPGGLLHGAEAVVLASRASAEALPVLFDRIEARGNARVYVRRLDVARDRGLDHHRIDGVPVLPGVIGVELMAEAAAHHAGRPVARLEDVSFDLPLKLHRDQPLDAQVEVVAKGNGVECRVVTHFVGPGGRTQRREHFRAQAVLGAPSTADAGPPHRLEMPRDPQITRDAIYQRYFHGPVFQVLTGEVLLGEDGVRAELIEAWPAWTAAVSHTAYETLPLAREAGFQAAGLWEMVELGRMALPAAVASIELGSRPAPGTKLVVEARRTSAGTSGSTFDVWIRDEAGKVYDVMRGYRTVKLRDLAPTERFEPRRHSGSAPTWFVVEVSEVQSMLAASSETALARYLSSTEQLRFHELKTDKRRIEWLAGRIAAKRLLREVSFAREGAVVPYAAITIASDELGAPRVSIVGDSRQAPALSITHSAGIAAALVAVEPGVRPGIDVEVVEVRDAAFSRDYFTDAERAAAAASARPDLVLTSTWAVKESVIKALGVGARVDLREVETIERNGSWHVTLHGEAQRRAQALGARSFEVQLDVHPTFVMARVLMRQDAGEAKGTPSLPAKEVLA